MIVEKVVLYIFSIFGHHGHSTNIHYWSESGTLRTLASGSESGPLKRVLPIVNWESLERSLPVVNGNPYNARYR